MNEAAWEASKALLLPCKNCGRRFAADRLPVHMKSCKETKPGIASPAQSDHHKLEHSKKPEAPQGPVYVICFICGRKYGSKSIDIHEPQCLDKWKIENANLPKKLQRPTPIRPDRSGMVTGNGGMDMDAMNEAAWQASKLQLIECENCGRRFQPDRLPVHQRSCRPGNVAKKIQTQPASTSSVSSMDSIRLGPNPSKTVLIDKNNEMDNISEYGSPGSLKPCKNCGRSFATDRLNAHMKACKGQKQRKIFDSKKMRVEGTEAASYVRNGKPAKEENVKQNNWRSKHEEFIAAIRYAKQADKVVKEGGDLKALPPPPVSSNPDYIQCPHCERKFNATAGERHIPKCKNTVNKPKPPPRKR